jgi:hypothetical protein
MWNVVSIVWKCYGTYEEYKRILELWQQEPNKKKISRIMGVPRKTVADCIYRYESVAGLEVRWKQAQQSTAHKVLKHISENPDVCRAYAYLLGLYLGDGYISKGKTHRAYLLRITLDKRYTNILRQCVKAISAILPNNRVGKISRLGCYDITCYYKHWPEIFPQHGEGAKHLRKIQLEDWQQTIVDENPLEFFRGLYHSDGSRSRNVVRMDYPRYMFCNNPRIFSNYSSHRDALGLHWTQRPNRSTAANLVFISRREDVSILIV